MNQYRLMLSYQKDVNLKEHTRSIWWGISVFILVLGGIWIWISRIPLDSAIYRKDQIPQTGIRAPSFNLTDLDGEVYATPELIGQPKVISLWAS